MISSKVKESLLKIETLPVSEIETIMSVINESAPNQIHVGSSCTNERNQVFTVIGFSDKDYSTSKSKPHELKFSLMLDPSSPQKFVYGLFYDPNSPERQEIIDC